MIHQLEKLDLLEQHGFLFLVEASQVTHLCDVCVCVCVCVE